MFSWLTPQNPSNHPWLLDILHVMVAKKSQLTSPFTNECPNWCHSKWWQNSQFPWWYPPVDVESPPFVDRFRNGNHGFTTSILAPKMAMGHPFLVNSSTQKWWFSSSRTVNPLIPSFWDVPRLTVRRAGCAAADAGTLLAGARLWRYPHDHGIVGVAWRQNSIGDRLGKSSAQKINGKMCGICNQKVGFFWW